MIGSAPPHVSWQRLPAGTPLNNTYEIDGPLGAGGMGEVYKGHQIATGHRVAIKLILPELEQNEAALNLFFKEASALFEVQHDAIVRYYSFAKELTLGRHFLALEFVDGRDLSEILQQNGPLPLEAVGTLLRRLASGLQAVHERGIIHRDLSPDNILIPNSDVSRAKIIDFGIARSLERETTVIGGGFAGKYSYVSPEQLGLFGGNVTAKSDIYSLGLVMVQALTGQPLDMSGSHVEVIEKRRRLPGLGFIDMRIRPLLEQMLRPDPADRIESMAAVADWPLGSTYSGRGARAQPKSESKSPASTATQRRTRRSRRAAVLVLLLALAGGGAVFVRSLPQSRTTAESETAGNTPAPLDPEEFVKRYDGGDCFYLLPYYIRANVAKIYAFGAVAEPFYEFSTRFQKAFKFDPYIPLTLIAAPQCPAINFLTRLRGADAAAPRIAIEREDLRNGDRLMGLVDHYARRNLDFLHVSDAGAVRNLSNELKPGTDAKTFDIPIRVTAGASGHQPQLLIALADARPIDALQPGQTADAAELFPRLLSDIATSADRPAAGLKHFWLEK